MSRSNNLHEWVVTIVTFDIDRPQLNVCGSRLLLIFLSILYYSAGQVWKHPYSLFVGVQITHYKLKLIIQLHVLDHLPVYHLLLALSDSNMYTNHQEIHHKQFLEVSVFWDNHITLHCMDGHFVSGTSLH